MLEIRSNPPLSNEELNALFGASWPTHELRNFQPILERSLAYIAAFSDAQLIGFVDVAWDGGQHGFVLDTTVHPEFRRSGVGLALLKAAERLARAEKLEWLHVDFEPELESFYRKAGYLPTAAGLLHLTD